MKKIIIITILLTTVIVGIGFLILNQQNNQLLSTGTKKISKETTTNFLKEDYSQLPAKVFIKDANFQTKSFGGITEVAPDGVTTISTPKNQIFTITQPTRIKNVRLGYEIVIPAGFSFINDGLRSSRPEEYIDVANYCKNFSAYGEGINCISFRLDASGFDDSNRTLRDKIGVTSPEFAYQQALSVAKDHPYIILGGYGFECNQPTKEFQNKIICIGKTEELPQLIPGAGIIKMTTELSEDYIESKKNISEKPASETINSITQQVNYTVFSSSLFPLQRNSVMNIFISGESKEFLTEAEKVISSLRLLPADDHDILDYAKIQIARDIFGRLTSYYFEKKNLPKNLNELDQLKKPRETYDTISLENKENILKKVIERKELLYSPHSSESGKVDGYRVGINLMDKNHPYLDYAACNNGKCLSKTGYGAGYFSGDNAKGCSGEDSVACFDIECALPLAKDADTNHQIFCARLMFEALR